MRKVPAHATLVRIDMAASDAVASAAIAFDETNGQLIRFDDVGARIWQRLARRCIFEQLIQEMADDFEGDASTIESDLLVFVSALLDRGLLKIADEASEA